MKEDRTELKYPPGMMLKFIIEGTMREIERAKRKAREGDKPLKDLAVYFGSKRIDLSEHLLTLSGNSYINLELSDPKRQKVVHYLEEKFDQLIEDIDKANPNSHVIVEKLYFIKGIAYTLDNRHSESIEEGLLYDFYFPDVDPIQSVISAVAFSNPLDSSETLYQIWNIFGMEKLVVGAGKVNNSSLSEKVLFKYDLHNLKV